MTTGDASLKISLQPSAFQAGLRQVVDMTTTAGRSMGRALKEPINAGLKSARAEIGTMFSDLKQGLKTVGTLGGALAVGSFIRDAAHLQRLYGDMAAQVNKVSGNAETWQTMQKRIEGEVDRTGQSAEALAEVFMSTFNGTNLENAQRAIRAIGTTSTATGDAMNLLGTDVQIAMTKFHVKTPEEALARIISGTGIGGQAVGGLGGSFEMLGEAADAAGHSGGAALSMLLNMSAEIGVKSIPGLQLIFQTMKKGSSQVMTLQKEMGRTVKFNADVSALERVKMTFMTAKGRAAAEKIFTADARVVYDKLAEPFDKAYKDATAAGLSKAEATKRGLDAFDANLERLSHASLTYAKLQETAASRIANDPGRKLDMAIEKIRLSFASPKMLGTLDRLADKLPAFADAVASIVDKIVSNPWESLAVVVGGKLAIAFGGSMVSEVIATGMKSLFTRMLAVQAASAAASVATGGATALGVGGAIGTGAGVAGVGAGASLATGAIVAGSVLAAGAVGYGAGTVAYKYGGIEERQNKEFDAVRSARETLMDTSSAKTPEQISKSLTQLQSAKKNLDQGSVTNSIVGFLARPFTTTGDPTARAAHDIEKEQKRLTEALRVLREGVRETGDAMKLHGKSTSRGPLRPAEPNPGARPVGG